MVSMLKRGLILIGIMLLPLMAQAQLPVAGVDSAGAAEQLYDTAGGDFQLEYSMQVDKTSLLGRLKAIMADERWFGKYPEVQKYLQLWESAGTFDFAQYRETLSVNRDELRYTVATDYNELAPESYKAGVFSLPNRPFASATYVNADVLLYFGMQNVPQYALNTLRYMANNPELMETEAMEELLSELGSGLGMGEIGAAEMGGMLQLLDALGIEDALGEFLTGEVALAVYGMENLAGLVTSKHNFNPADLHAAMFVGVADGASAAGMLESYGADMGIVPAGEAPGWKLYKMQGDESITFALGQDVLIASTNWEAINRRMMLRIARIDPAPGQYFFSLNLDRLCDQLGPLVSMAEAELLNHDELSAGLAEQGMPAPEVIDAAMRYVLDIDNLGGAGAVRIHGYYEPNGYRSELTMKPSVFMYALYALGRYGGAFALQEMLSQKSYGAWDEQTDGAAPPEAGQDDIASILPGGDDELE